MDDLKRQLAAGYGPDPDCRHERITAQYMYSGATEARCHRCMKLIVPGPDEALLPSMVDSEDDPDTPGTKWRAIGYRLVKLGVVTIEPRLAAWGGGFAAQTAIRRGGAVRRFSAIGATRVEAATALRDRIAESSDQPVKALSGDTAGDLPR